MPPLVQALALFAVGLVAGTLNVVAGGGSLLTLPLLIFMGLPATVANGTNRIGILVQNLGASWAFHRRGLLDGNRFRMAVGPMIAGAVAGTWTATRVGDVTFQRVLAGVMVLAAVALLWRPRAPAGGTRPPSASLAVRAALFAGWLGAGFFAGFIQAGVGFLLLALAALAGLDLVRGNALKVTLVLAFTPASLWLFAREGMVDWPLGLALAAGTLLGGQFGVHLAAVKGHSWIRKVVTVTVIAFALRLWWSA